MTAALNAEAEASIGTAIDQIVLKTTFNGVVIINCNRI